MKSIGGISSFFTAAVLVAACQSNVTSGAPSTFDDATPSPTKKPFAGTISAAQAVGGSVHGLSGGGLTLTNGSETIQVSADGAFAFAKKAPAGAHYEVLVSAQPKTPWQTCEVFNGKGEVGKGGVTNITVECSTDVHHVGGKVFGLAGSGLALKINGAETITPAASGDFVFPTALRSGALYSVEVAAQPKAKDQVCTVAGGMGMVGGGEIGTVVVSCTTTGYPIGGSVSGLLGTLVLSSAGVDTTVTANGTYALPPVEDGSTYAVTVKSQPTGPSQTCVVAHASGTVSGAPRSDLDIVCTTNTYAVGGSVAGLAGTGLVLQDNLGDDYTVGAGDTSFAFATKVASGQPYAVTVKTQPSSPNQTCTVAGDQGTVGAGAVSSVVINCTTTQYAIGGSVSNLKGTVVLSNGGVDTTVTSSNGTYAFPPVDDGSDYAVTVKTQPTVPVQVCSLAGASGTVSGAAVSNIGLSCVTTKFNVGGTVDASYAGSGLVLQNNGGANLTVPQSATGFTFGTKVDSGASYGVSVLTNPTNPWQTCSVASASGPVTNADITAPSVTCTTNSYALKVQVTGLAAQPIKITNGSELLTFATSGTQSFTTTVSSGSAYNVTIDTAPSDIPCFVTGGSGTMAGADATVNVVCGHIFSNAPASAFSSYSQCYGDLYSHPGSTLATDIAAACTKSKILMACRQVGSSTFTAVAIGARSDAFYDVGTGNTTHDANGVGWYFTTQANSSIGFAPAGAGIMRSSADIAGTGTDDALRLSWHSGTGATYGGYRCGATRSLNSSTAWERLVYQAD